jgi:hypothetical protein
VAMKRKQLGPLRTQTIAKRHTVLDEDVAKVPAAGSKHPKPGRVERKQLGPMCTDSEKQIAKPSLTGQKARVHDIFYFHCCASGNCT